MAVEIGTAVVNVIPSARGFSSRMRGELGGLDSIGIEAGQRASAGFVAGFGSRLTEATKLASVALAGVSAAAGGFGIKIAAQNEQAAISFETMLGSAEAAQSFLADLKSFAARTPFDLPGLQTAASSLISVGVSAEKVVPIMTSLGNATSGMGTGAEGVRRATVALQQMNAAGRVTAEDLNQLRDAGIPVFDLLTAATGKTKEELSAMAASGKLGRKELEQLMAALESGAGLERFAGLMDKQSQSLVGLWSTLKDTIGQGLASVMEPTVRSIKAQLPALSSAIETAMRDVGPIFATSAADIVGSFGRLLPIVTPLVSTLAKITDAALDPMLRALELAAPPAVVLAEALGRLAVSALDVAGTALAQVFAAVAPLAAQLSDAFVALLSQVDLPAVGAALGTMAGSAGKLVQASAPLVALFAQFAGQALAEIWKLLPDVTAAFAGLVQAVIPLLPAMTELARDVLVGALVGLKELVPSLVRLAVVSLPLLTAWGELKLLFWDLLVKVLTPLIPALTKLIDAAIPLLEKVVVPMVTKLAEWTAALADTKGGLVLLGAAIGALGFAKLAAGLLSFIIPGKSALGVLTLLTYAFRAHFSLIETQGVAGMGRYVQVLGKTLTGINVVAAAQAVLNVLMSPWVLIPAAIIAVGAALYLAYQRFEPFRNAVDAVVEALKVAVEWVREFASALFAGDWSQVTAMLSDLGGVIVDKLATLGNLIRDKAGEWAAALWGWVQEAVPAALAKLGEFAAAIGTWIVTVAVPTIARAAAGLATAFVGWVLDVGPKIATALVGLGGRIFDWILNDAVPMVIDNVGRLAEAFVTWVACAAPRLASALSDLLANLPGWIASGLSTAGSAIGTALTTAFNWVKDNWTTIVKGLLLAAVATPAMIVFGLKTLGPKLFEAVKAGFGWLANNWQNVIKSVVLVAALFPAVIVGALVKLGPKLFDALKAGFDWVKNNWQLIIKGLALAAVAVPALIIAAVVKLGPMLLGALKSAFDFVVSSAGTVLAGIGEFISSLPQRWLNLLSSSLSFILTFVFNAVTWFVQRAPAILQAVNGFFTSLPGKFVEAIGALGSFLVDNVFTPAFNWIVTQGPVIIQGIIDFFAGLPGKFVAGLAVLGGLFVDGVKAAFSWVVTQGPIILQEILDFFAGLPGKFVAGLGVIGGLILDALKGAFNWVVENGPGMIQGLIDFFTGLPTKIFETFKRGLEVIGGAALDLAKTLWNAVAGFLNDHLIAPIKVFKVEIGPVTATPFEFLPALPMLASGGPLAGGQPAIVGERGPELWWPDVAGRIVPASRLNVGPAAPSAGFRIDHLEVKGADQPRDTAFAVANDLRWLSLMAGQT